MLLSYHQKGCIPLTTVSYIHLIVFKMLFETENLSITKPPQANFSEPNQNPPVRRKQERDSLLRKKPICFTGDVPGVLCCSLKTPSKLLLWPQSSQSDRVTEEGSRDRTSSCLPGHPSGLLLACVLGWQGSESDPEGPSPCPPSVQGTSQWAWRLPGGFFHPGGTARGRHPSCTPLTAGSPCQAGGHGSLGCSGRSPVRSRGAGRRTGRSLGRRVSAHWLSPPGCSCRLGDGNRGRRGCQGTPQTTCPTSRGPREAEKVGSPGRRLPFSSDS